MEFINITGPAVTQITGWHSILFILYTTARLHCVCLLRFTMLYCIACCSFSVIFSLRATMLINLNVNLNASLIATFSSTGSLLLFGMCRTVSLHESATSASTWSWCCVPAATHTRSDWSTLSDLCEPVRYLLIVCETSSSTVTRRSLRPSGRASPTSPDSSSIRSLASLCVFSYRWYHHHHHHSFYFRQHGP